MHFSVSCSRLLAAGAMVSLCWATLSAADKLVERTPVTKSAASNAVAGESVPSKAESALLSASEAQKFTFVLFWKENSTLTRERAGLLKSAIGARAKKAAWTSVKVTDPSERALVQKFQVSRAPMPLVLAVAPNGAVTGVFDSEFTEELIDESIVTPCMTRCMKSLQEGKLVLVCIHPEAAGQIPQGLKDFRADPHFRDRTVSFDINAQDPDEARFLKDMQIDPKAMKSPVTAFLAPPGVLVGKFRATATKDQLAAGLAAAGKCCEDPNCKHHQPRK